MPLVRAHFTGCFKHGTCNNNQENVNNHMYARTSHGDMCPSPGATVCMWENAKSCLCNDPKVVTPGPLVLISIEHTLSLSFFHLA